MRMGVFLISGRVSTMKTNILKYEMTLLTINWVTTNHPVFTVVPLSCNFTSHAVNSCIPQGNEGNCYHWKWEVKVTQPLNLPRLILTKSRVSGSIFCHFYIQSLPAPTAFAPSHGKWAGTEACFLPRWPETRGPLQTGTAVAAVQCHASYAPGKQSLQGKDHLFLV